MITLIKNFLNGIAFGITETVPGVSGGTIAIIIGFYDKMLESVNHFTKEPRKSIKFLAPFFIGLAGGIFAFASIINYLLANFSFPTMLFFIGLIVGIIPIIFLKVKKPGRKFKAANILLIVAPIILLIAISNLKGVSVVDPAEFIGNMSGSYMIFIFFAGTIAASALIIPGISGSFVLLLMGVYPLATYSISSLRLYLADIKNIALLLDIFKVLAPLAIGVVIGGLTMARLIEKLLKNYSEIIYSIILGLITGSVYALFNEPIVYKSGVSPLIIAIGALTFLLGGATSFFLGKKKL